MADVRHIGFLKFNFLTAEAVKGIILQNFVKNSWKKSTLPGTRDAAGQFRDCPGESVTVGNRHTICIKISQAIAQI